MKTTLGGSLSLARKYCDDHGGTLPKIYNNEELTLVKGLL